MSPPLPENWVEQRTPDGGVYYVNTETDQSQWHFPAENTSSPLPPPASPPAASSSIAPSSSSALSERKEEYETGCSVSDSAREFKVKWGTKIVEKGTGTKVFTFMPLSSFSPMMFYTAEHDCLFEVGATEPGSISEIAVVNKKKGHIIATFQKVRREFAKTVYYGYRGYRGAPFIQIEILRRLSRKIKMTEIATGRELGSILESYGIHARVEAGVDAALILCMMFAVREWLVLLQKQKMDSLNDFLLS
ncbi:WW domain containing protein [Gracilaria domingensis]|nr:WW domain containing protein [Gracilaria domingensis]